MRSILATTETLHVVTLGLVLHHLLPQFISAIDSPPLLELRHVVRLGLGGQFVDAAGEIVQSAVAAATSALGDHRVDEVCGAPRYLVGWGDRRVLLISLR